AYRQQQGIDSGAIVVVGVNRFATSEEPVAEAEAVNAELFTIDPEIERQQVARVQAIRRTRDASAWRAALEGVRSAARGGDSLVPPIIAAVEASATVGEIADAMRDVFGEYREASLE